MYVYKRKHKYTYRRKWKIETKTDKQIYKQIYIYKKNDEAIKKQYRLTDRNSQKAIYTYRQIESYVAICMYVRGLFRLGLLRA